MFLTSNIFFKNNNDDINGDDIRIDSTGGTEVDLF